MVSFSSFMFCLRGFVLLGMMAFAVSSFAQEDDASGTYNKNLVASTEKLFRRAKWERGRVYEIIPSEICIALIGGASQNLTYYSATHATMATSLYAGSDYLDNSALLWGVSLGFRKNRHTIEPSVLFSRVMASSMIDDVSYVSLFDTKSDPIALKTSSLKFSTPATDLAVRYKYFLYSSAVSWFEIQVGGYVGMIFSSEASTAFKSYQSTSSNASFSFSASGKSLPYVSLYVGGMAEASIRLSRLITLGLELGVHYNFRTFDASLQYTTERVEINGGNTATYTKSANADVSLHFLMLRPLVKLAYHIPTKVKRKTP